MPLSWKKKKIEKRKLSDKQPPLKLGLKQSLWIFNCHEALVFAGEKKQKICLVFIVATFFIVPFSCPRGFTQSLWKSYFSVRQRALHIWIDQNIAVFSSLNLRVFSWMFRSIGIAEREDSLYTSIPLCFPSRENARMSYCCILPSPPVWSVYVHTCVFNICKIPKMFAQRILLFPVYFIWCLPWRKNPVD